MSWNPTQYEKFKKERTAPFYDLTQMIQAGPLFRAIDLGCGTGELTRELHEKFRIEETTGIDTATAMLARAPRASGLTFFNRAIEQFDAAGAYDLVFSNAAIQWVPQHEELFKKFFRALKMGGQLAIQMPFNHDHPTHQIALELRAAPKYRDYLPPSGKSNLLSPDEYSRILFKLGFTSQQVRVQVYPHVLDSREEVIEWVKGTLLTFYESKLSPDLFKEFLQDYQKQLFARIPDEKPFFFPFKRILIWARVA